MGSQWRNRCMRIMLAIPLIFLFIFLIPRPTPIRPPRPHVTAIQDMEEWVDGTGKEIRVVVLSDTHMNHDLIKVPPGDVLIHAGDWSTNGKESEIRAVDKWFGSLPHPTKLVISGNMDGIGVENRRSKWPSDPVFSNAIYLQDSFHSVCGLRFYGSPWTPIFVGGFQLPDQHTAELLWAQLPSNIDVLITHGPPYGILDRSSNDHKPLGDQYLLEAVRRVHPRLHVFGHIHNSYGTSGPNAKTGQGRSQIITWNSQTTFVNAAVFDVHAPFVFDLRCKLE